jgi:transposase
LPDTPAATAIADKAYDAQERVIDPLGAGGKNVVISSKRCRKQPRDYGKHLYRAVHLIEQFFNSKRAITPTSP